MKRALIYILLMATTPVWGVGSSGMYQYSVALSGYISSETGKAPTAYLWIPEGCQRVKAVVFAQQNMTEEMLFKNQQFRQKMQQLDVALLWIAPWFTQNWDASTGCQQVFEEMMTAIAYQSNHLEIAKCPVIPFGHSAQASFPWNFAAWNPERTLCVISFHGDAPRTNLCGYGTANVEWGRKRNIDGIPGLMIEGEYEWWEARVRPALAFRMMYPNSCISFLCDAGSGHFECMPETADYIAKFIEKAMQCRMPANSQLSIAIATPHSQRENCQLKRLSPRDGWLACRYNPDLQPSDGDGAQDDIFAIDKRPQPAPYADYQGDRHDAFWYFDQEMAELTEARYAETRGKQVRPLEKPTYTISSDGKTVTVSVPADVHVEVISGPLRKIASRQPSLNSKRSTLNFEIYPYEAGLDNPKRSYTAWLVAIHDGDSQYKRAVHPIEVKLPNPIKK